MTAQPDIIWGISTLGCHELDLPAICRLAVRHEIHHLEIRCLADCLHLPDYLDKTYPDNPGAIQQILDEYLQSVIALNSGFSLIGSGKNDREDLLAFARWADLLDIPYIRVFGGGSMIEPLSSNDLKLAVENLEWWQNQRNSNNWTVQLALETHDGFSSAGRCLQLQDALSHPLNIIWDTHHTWKLGNESPQQTWEQIAPLVCHIHIKDSISVPSARHPYTYVLPGGGEFPADKVFSLLHRDRYHGIVSLEWERKWHPYLPDLDTALNALTQNGWRSEKPEPVPA